MSNPCVAQREANIEIDKIINDFVKEAEGSLDVNYLILQLTSRHAIYESHIMDRISRWLRIYPSLVLEKEILKNKPKQDSEKKKKGKRLYFLVKNTYDPVNRCGRSPTSKGTISRADKRHPRKSARKHDNP